MKRIYKTTAVIACLALGFGVWQYARSPDIKDVPVVHNMNIRTVHDFQWQDMDGGTHKFSDLKGHIVVVHFWASWCQPCMREFPALIDAAKKSGDDVIFLTLSGDEDAQAAKKFLDKMKAEKGAPGNMLYGIDPKQDIIWGLYGNDVFPGSIIYGRDLVARHFYSGMTDWRIVDPRNDG